MLTTTGPGLRLRAFIVTIRIIVTVIQTRIAIFIIADVQTFTIIMSIISNLVFDMALYTYFVNLSTDL